MKLGIDLKVDYAFKWTFGAQERIENLRSLLENVLKERFQGPIEELTILNPIQNFDQWVYLFCNSEELDPDSPPKELTLPRILRSLKEMQIMSQTEQERIRYESRQKAIHDEVSRRNYFEKQAERLRQESLKAGLEEGLKEGLKKVEEERETARRKMRIIKQINLVDVELQRQGTPIDELFELPEETLQQILEELENSRS